MAPHSTTYTSPSRPSSTASMPAAHANGITPSYGRDAQGPHIMHDELKPRAASIPIAIVGMACRFSGGVANPSQLWELCAEGRDGWSPIPESRFDVKSLYHRDGSRTGRSNVTGGYFLEEDIALFDAAFFNLASDVASGLDPQVRLLLESVYEATEDAGIPLNNISGTNTSVFTGTFNKDYHEVQTKDAEVLSRSFLAGTGTAMLSNRISHFFDLQGPSVSIDTGCSSGMVAVHHACQSIRTGESEISIVGASSTLLSQDAFISASTVGAIGADGRCHAWDSRAAGYGRGEGVATLILKPLEAALHNGDQIHAVIKDTGVNQNGKTTTITSPSTEAQVKLIQECYRRAGLDIADTAYVEAHMTGTAAGDPVEAEAIARTFGKHRRDDDPVLVGSVKTNVGHTEPVSGLAAVIKTCFTLKHAQIAPNLNYKLPHPKIDLQNGHMFVPTALTPWPINMPLRASVNNFGYGGTNAHAILEPAPIFSGSWSRRETIAAEPEANDLCQHSRVFILSAKDSSACETKMHQLSSWVIEKSPGIDDLAYTLAERRTRHPWVTAVRGRSIEGLSQCLNEPNRKASFSNKIPRLGFVFNGQGAQWHAMGRELIIVYPVFARAISAAGEVLRKYGASWSLIEELMRDTTSTRVADAEFSQPISVAIQIALIDLLKSWAVWPTAITSHSSGEISAAYTAGMLSFRQALGVAFYRGEIAGRHLQNPHTRGGMLAVGLGQSDAEEYISRSWGGVLTVACINSPSNVTISGHLEAIEELAAKLDGDGIFSRKLKVPLAYHSHHMLPMAPEYGARLEELLNGSGPHKRANTLFISPVTGASVTSAKSLGPSHWVGNMIKPVQFCKAFASMCQESFDPSSQSGNVDLIVEIGAHSTLAGPIRQIMRDRDGKMPYVSCLKRNINAVDTMQDLACQLLESGFPVDLEAVNFPTGDAKPKLVTGLPSYPWNHKKRFWVEPRIAHEQRYKKFEPHELLGSPLNGSTSLSPTWRNHLRREDIPWLNDHQIDGTTVFPGAGYITMAIEAVQMLTDNPLDNIHSYRLRDIDILNGLVIPESEQGIEIQLCLRPCSKKNLDYEGWFDFDICSLSNKSWIQNCRGSVSVKTEHDQKQTTASSESIPPLNQSSFLPDTKTTSVDLAKLFEGLRDRGIYHGPIFRNLVSSTRTESRAVTAIQISDMVSDEHDYILHPTTLDSIFQASFCSMPDTVQDDAMVLPRSIQLLEIGKDFERRGGMKLQAFSKLVIADKRGYTSDIRVATDSQTKSSVLKIEGFYGSSVPRHQEFADEALGICSTLRWEPDILHNPPPSFRSSMVIPLQDHEVELERKLSRVSYNFISEAVNELHGLEPDSLDWHLRRFYSWMIEIVAQGQSGELGPNSQSWSKASVGAKKMLADELSADSPAGKLTVRVGRNLARIVRGEIMPLELMMENDLLNQFYMHHEALKTRSYSHLANIASLYAAKNPGANVLEIGGGTGGATGTILEAFSNKYGSSSGTNLGSYTFTDISPGFFEAAREKFAPWAGMMQFKKLDIETDPLSQSFSQGSFDLIVAASVLHATKSLTRTMQHVRKLLKPGGTLLLIEATSDRLEGQLIFGTLPGWWLGEEPERQTSPNAPLAMWDRILRQTGFTGVDFEISDYEEVDFQSARVMIARTIPTVQGQISIITTSTAENSAASTWLAQLSAVIEDRVGIVPNIVNLDNISAAHGTTCLVTMEMDHPFVSNMDSVQFERLQDLFLHAEGVLWLSRGGLIDCSDPSYSASEGLLRTMRQEYSYKRWIRLDFEQGQSPWTIDKFENIVHVLQHSFNNEAEASDVDWEFSVKDSQLYVPRIYPDKLHDAVLRNAEIVPDPELQLFTQERKPLIWEVSNRGAMSLDCHFVENSRLLANEIPDGQLEVEARAFGLNFREVMVALGQLEESLTGHECSGVVTGLGPGTEQSGLTVGDRVAALCKYRLASRSRTHWTSVVKLPDDIAMSWEEAASFPAAYTTAYGSLIQVAQLQKDETVLVHAASGATGQAAITIAQYVGAEVFATCSTDEKRAVLVQNYGIRPDHIFDSRSDNFASAIMEATKGRGVDVILNSLSGPLLGRSWDCMARFGRFVDITKVDTEARRQLEMAPFSRCATFSSFDLLQLTEYRGSLTHSALSESLKIICAKSVAPVHPITQYSISNMAVAMRQMQGGAHIGKLVLVPGRGDKVKVISRPNPLSLSHQEEAYLVVGGLGGIGRAIAEWLIEQGTKNLVLVSRHATTNPGAPLIREKGTEAGCQVVIYDCDVSDEEDLLRLVNDCAMAGVPPIRGVINGAMVLDDTVLERMTFEQWENGVRPKIKSSLNLHSHLPCLKFFVMLSSVAGVAGHTSQANYAAGNSFEDALARHRAVSGLAAVTIDLGAVRSVGYVAEKESEGDERLRARVEAIGFGSIDIAQVLRIVEYAIREPIRKSPVDSQIILGPNQDTLCRESGMRLDRRFGTLRVVSQRGLIAAPGSSNRASAADLSNALSKAATIEEATVLLIKAISAKIAEIFNLGLSDIDVALPMSRYGVDSLVAVELRNWLNGGAKAKVTVFEILQSASLNEFSALVATQSETLKARALV
ncbi:hypothetical protein ARSEF1564_009747 [Beauveria bassiana]